MRLAQTIFLFLFLMYSTSGFAQTGCTDPQALNFDSTAVYDDGSCVYPTTQYAIPERINLSSELHETSGLTYFDGALWTINDSDNLPHLYKVSSTDGTVIGTWPIDPALNYDWEALTHSDQFIFIADFGNNAGNRTNLHILRIPRTQLATEDTLTPDEIHFSFAEQTDFNAPYQQSNYDVEAIFHHADTLYIFTKNWDNQKTYLYGLPATPDTFSISVIDSMDVGGLVTGASYNEHLQIAVLTGYENMGNGIYRSFCWILKDFQGTDFLGGNKRRIELGLSIGVGQNEGIFLFGDGTGYISAEQIQPFNASAFLNRFDFAPFIQGTLYTYENDIAQIKVHPVPASQWLELTVPKSAVGFDVEFYNNSAAIIERRTIRDTTEALDISLWPAGHYIAYIPKLHWSIHFVIID